MDICSDGHEEIVHNERGCPLCAALKNIDGRDGAIKDLNGQLESLSSDLKSVEDILESAKKEVDDLRDQLKNPEPLANV